MRALRPPSAPLLPTLALLVLAATGPGCNADAPGSPAASDVVGPGSTALLDSRVSVLDSGPVRNILACSGRCIYQHGFWVDLSVANEAYEKDVGIVWTRDGWASHQTARARYEGELGDGRERWGVDVRLEQGPGEGPEVEYAVYVTMNGETSWDPLNNHFIQRSVTFQRPVRLLASGVRYEPGLGPVLEGDVRVLNLGFEKAVSVRYTLDDWASWLEAPATWVKNQDWRFHLALGDRSPLPGAVKFAVRYRVLGREFWDRRDGFNYEHALRPVFHPVALPAEPLSGIWTVGGSFTTALPTLRTDVRVDQGDWQEGPHRVLSTAGLADGAHRATVRLTVVGGYTEEAAVDFAVRNRVQPLPAWSLTPQAHAQDYPWDFAYGPDQSLYLLWSGGQVARHAQANGSGTPFLYPSQGSAHRIAVDARSRLYVLASHNGTQVTRFLPSGAVDSTFGQSGAVSLSGDFAGQPFCYPGYLAVGAGRVLVTDTCNGRLVAFDEAGTFREALPLPADPSGYGIPHQAIVHGTDVWVPQRTQVTRLSLAGGALRVVGTVALEGVELNGAEGGVVKAGRLWLSDGGTALRVFSLATGKQETVWGYGDAKRGLLGEAPTARALTWTPDGSVGVLSAGAVHIARFAATLR